MDSVFLIAPHYRFFLYRTKRFLFKTMACQALVSVINQLVFAQDFEDRGGCGSAAGYYCQCKTPRIPVPH